MGSIKVYRFILLTLYLFLQTVTHAQLTTKVWVDNTAEDYNTIIYATPLSKITIEVSLAEGDMKYNLDGIFANYCNPEPDGKVQFQQQQQQALDQDIFEVIYAAADATPIPLHSLSIKFNKRTVSCSFKIAAFNTCIAKQETLRFFLKKNKTEIPDIEINFLLREKPIKQKRQFQQQRQQ